ncbi:MAG: tRNA(Ile2) 2-agmatinylcytidine synthetase [Candidatus Korarchaeum sp.]|nr:tRNA(Ile2) 2-agmatinylcytidine synthetase [Candidatus Korarchaeum sp.]
MITLTPSQIKSKFGELFSKNFLTIVDEKNKVVEIIEECTAKGPVEWDLINRLRAGGVVYSGWVEGNTLYLRARIGSQEVKFGPADLEHGGQALEKVEVTEEEVHTYWIGAAGAGLGLVACLSQAPGVLRAEYPSQNDLEKVGGANVNRVKIITPKMRKVIIGVDDTDRKDRGATWASLLKAGKELSSELGVRLLSHRIFQCFPGVSWKTTNNVSSAVSLAIPWSMEMDSVLNKFLAILKNYCYSESACIVAYEGVEIPIKLKEFGIKVKNEVIDVNYAKKLSEELDLKVIPVTGERGVVGALAAVGLFDSGIEYAALSGDPGLGRVRSFTII